jgi:hypothetical protein
VASGISNQQGDFLTLMREYMDLACRQQECFNRFLHALGSWADDVEAEREWIRQLRQATLDANVDVGSLGQNRKLTE